MIATVPLGLIGPISYRCAMHTGPVATPICSIVNLVFSVTNVLFFLYGSNHMGLQTFLSLVARAASLGNSCNLHKSNMAATDSGFASGWDIIQLIYLKSCVTPLYQIIFYPEIDFCGQFGD